MPKAKPKPKTKYKPNYKPKHRNKPQPIANLMTKHKPYIYSFKVNLIYLARNVPPRWQDYLLKALVPYSAVVWVIILASLIAQIIFGVFIRKVEIKMKLEIDFSPFKVNKRQKIT